jgi:hypothetical protein
VIPDFINIGSDWEALPPGIHIALIAEIESRFATNAKRRILFDGFILGLESLIQAGCQSIYLDGSFISQKLKYGGEFFPSTFDAVKGSTFLEYFQIDKATGHTKGIIRIEIQPQAEGSKI